MVKKLLFNPGPTNVSEKVREAIKTPDICHREKEFSAVLARVRAKILKVVNGSETHSAVAFVSSATGCNEAVISSLDGKVLLINNGKYAQRLKEIIERYNIALLDLKFDSLQPVDLARVEQALRDNPDVKYIAMVHHETTTGMLVPLRQIGELAKKYNKVLFADTVSSLGGYKIDVQQDNLGFCTVSANKCLQSFPGIAFVIAKKDELAKLEGKSRSFYFDLYKQWQFQEEKTQTPFTSAVQLFFALDKALDELLEEGIENRAARYKKNAELMRAGLKELGFQFLLSDNLQSNILTAIKMPQAFDYWQVHDALKERGYTIYSGKALLDQGIFRIATLGNLNEENIRQFLRAFKEVLQQASQKI